MDLITAREENLHACMQNLSIINRASYTKNDKYDFLEQISTLTKNTHLKNRDTDNSIIARLLKYGCQHNGDPNILNVNDRSNFLTCTFDQSSDTHYVFCGFCMLFTDTKSMLTKGCKIESYSKTNAIICSHEKSIQHRKACEAVLEVQRKKSINDSSLTPSKENTDKSTNIATTTTTTITTTSVTTWRKANEFLTTSTSSCVMSEGCEKSNNNDSSEIQSIPQSVPYSSPDKENKLELEPIGRNRKIVFDVICCVLLILSLGNYSITLYFICCPFKAAHV